MEKSVFVDPSLDGNIELEEEVYIDEREKCNCNNEECEKCDPLWTPGIDTDDESETESDYDSDDSMDDVYEDCGLSRAEKKILQDELHDLIQEAENSILREQDPAP